MGNRLPYISGKHKINEFHGVDSAADEVIIFANPCTLQIVSKHWTDEVITSPAKAVNAPLIEKYTGVKGYKGRADQIDQVMKSITAKGYGDFRKRIQALDADDQLIGSTNAGKLFDWFESDVCEWIERCNSILER